MQQDKPQSRAYTALRSILTAHAYYAFLLHWFILASPRCTLTRNGRKKGEEIFTTAPTRSYYTQVHAYYTLRILTTHLAVKVASAVGNVAVRVVRLHTHTHTQRQTTHTPPRPDIQTRHSERHATERASGQGK